MLIRKRRGWELPESAATPEELFRRRRELVKGIAAGPLLLAGGLGLPGRARAAEAEQRWGELYPAPRNTAYRLDERLPGLSDERLVTTYNNFYEYGSHKQIWQSAQALVVHPWTVVLDGMVEKEQMLDIDDLLRRMSLEERVYRLRCVEAWSMAVPWSGFPMKALVNLAAPLGSARYLRMETFQDAEMAPGQRQFWYPWPYIEGLTMGEATNELAFIATGLYGKPIPRQNGAPLRLAVPWKYGFKSIKSIVRFTFTDERPVNFWQEIQASEYGFWANVNPEVPHPRWSQAEETPLGSPVKVPTRIFNGYEEFVAELYMGLKNEPLFM
jgi:methionine sulfoxide reductase catalytic subunit